MGLRELLYMSELWDLQRREWEDGRVAAEEQLLWPVVPLVLYTGERAWNTPISLTSLMRLTPALEEFVPGWKTLFLDLHETSPEVLTQFATAVGWALRVLQAERMPVEELERVLREAMDGIEGLSEEQRGQWLRVAWYLMLLVLHRRDEPGLRGLLLQKAAESKFHEREEIAAMGQTLYERIQAEGEARGIARGEALGEERGLRLALKSVLTARLGPLPSEVEAVVDAADVDRINAWLPLAAKASTLEEVGILPQGGRQ